MAIVLGVGNVDKITDPGHLEALRRLEMIAAYTVDDHEMADLNAMALSGAWATPAYQPSEIGSKAGKKLRAMYSKK
ncbi:hypothetical protein SEA_SEPHIROTH_100 [Gordonia Phage Sephiroth]|uniref:Uncharacterized protein n=1 Tax=Gordonia Phage Sephiroth TaxID=2767553 RepID=A0A7G9UZI0_9CAUD|nr:hypothetical protein L3Y23_gp130 [Gordonia Phage Sephiroth]QNN99435.1 hypothetical protein SEA_SEPHIROTH_100 [Gordonia Phage Sephiroth]